MLYALFVSWFFVIYLVVSGIKNRNMIKDLYQQVNTLKGTVLTHNNEIVLLKNKTFGDVAYKILKENCRKMGICHWFK